MALINSYVQIQKIATFNQDSVPPVGSIIPWVGGYFGNGSNGTFTNVLANTVANVNALLNAGGWYVCDGAALNIASSPIFNGANRYLPNLTDERFIQGNTTAGSIGGSNTMLDHTHSFTTGSESADHTHTYSGTTSSNGSHNHIQAYDYQWTGRYGGAETGVATNRSEQGASFTGTQGALTSTASAHTHTFSGTTSGKSATHTHSGTAGTGSAATSTNVRPKYLSTFYIMRVK